MLAAMVWLSNPTSESIQPAEMPDAMSLINMRANVNNDGAESAPQQQVVNGWQTADLLELSVMQNNLLLNSQIKLATLLALFVIAFSADRICIISSRRTN